MTMMMMMMTIIIILRNVFSSKNG